QVQRPSRHGERSNVDDTGLTEQQKSKKTTSVYPLVPRVPARHEPLKAEEREGNLTWRWHACRRIIAGR
ncbi:MAG: hypothetical protein VYD49_17585, partial [Pseudomonadota bacterium]|nr:hypothetical protein [Pseudomonadota bacterium]